MSRLARLLIYVAAGVVLALPLAAQAAPYVVDGYIEDWNVTLTTSGSSLWTTFDPDSFIPDPVGTIDYWIGDYPTSDVRPPGGEEYDYEAMYFDDTPGWLHVGVISSHEWSDFSTLYLEFDGLRYYVEDFDEFAWRDLGIDEVFSGVHFPNYFWEGAICIAGGGGFSSGTIIQMFADQECRNDDIGGGATPDHNPTPEPATILLAALGVVAVVASSRARRKLA